MFFVPSEIWALTKFNSWMTSGKVILYHKEHSLQVSSASVRRGCFPTPSLANTQNNFTLGGEKNPTPQSYLHYVLPLAASAHSAFISALAVASLQSIRRGHTRKEEF